jgi:alpha-mannosidase
LRALPNWCRVDQAAAQADQAIFLAPSVTMPRLPADLGDAIHRGGGLLIQGDFDRRDLIGRILTHLAVSAAPIDAEELADDFLALGYAYWQVRLMTSQLRYSSHLESDQFWASVSAAALEFGREAWAECRANLQSAFDLLLQERNRYFPVDALLVDLVLTAPSTLGRLLESAVKSPHPINVLLTGDLLQKIADDRPDLIEILRRRVTRSPNSPEPGMAPLEVIGGSAGEPLLPVISLESIVRDFRHGLDTFQRVLGTTPWYFGRRRQGFSANLPQLLSSFGFKGAVHAPFDGGNFPAAAGGLIEWQSPDGTTIPALAERPIDAAQPDSFLRLGVRIGESFDSAHGASVLFAHWPGAASVWFEDLVRAQRYGPVFGRFVTLREYFQQAVFSGRRDAYSQDQYRGDWPGSQIAAAGDNPLSRIRNYWRNQRRLAECRGLGLMAFLAGSSGDAADPEESLSLSELANDRSILDGGEPFAPQPALDALSPPALANRVLHLRDRLARAVARGLIGEPEAEGDSDAVAAEASAAGSEHTHLLVINPAPISRRTIVGVGPGFRPAVGLNGVYAVEEAEAGGFVGVEVPAMGYTLVPAKGPKRSRFKLPPIVSSRVLRNEYFELEIDERTGGIRSIHADRQRGSLLAQMLSLRVPTPLKVSGATDPDYVRPNAQSIRTTIDGRLVGEIESCGQLKVGDRLVAEFRQRVRVERGRRLIELNIELVAQEPLSAQPWDHYLCSRFAWQSDAAEVWRGVNETRVPAPQMRLEAPTYIEVVDTASRVTILTGGLPLHRRYEFRKLDALLHVSRETESRYRLGIGIDVASAEQAAVDFADPPWARRYSPRRGPGQATAWLFHVTCRNLLTLSIEPAPEGGFANGVRVRLKETEGRSGTARIQCGRPIGRAVRVRLDGEVASELTVVGGDAEFGFVGHEYFQIELRW